MGQHCNSRRQRAHPKQPKVQAGEWAGEWESPEGIAYWYCKKPSGHGMGPEVRTGRCKRHRGADWRGPRNPQWKDGRRARVPQHLEAAVAASLADENQLAMRLQLALLDGRQQELLDRMAEGTGALEDAVRAEAAMTRARERGDGDGLGDAWEQLRAALSASAAYEAAWAEMYTTMNLRRHIARTDAQRIALAQEMVDRAQLAVMVERLGRAIVEALETTVTDAKERLAARDATSRLIRGYLEA